MQPIDKLKQQYNELIVSQVKETDISPKQYNILREFCIECEILTFNEIELMEFEVNNLFS